MATGHPKIPSGGKARWAPAATTGGVAPDAPGSRLGSPTKRLWRKRATDGAGDGDAEGEDARRHATLTRHFGLAVNLALAGSVTWLLARIVKQVVERGRPPGPLDAVRQHGPRDRARVRFRARRRGGGARVGGQPHLSRPTRRVAWAVAAAVCIVRCCVGAHLPLDVVGGAALGWAIGTLVHLLLGAPGERPSVERTTRALVACGLDPD